MRLIAAALAVAAIGLAAGCGSSSSSDSGGGSTVQASTPGKPVKLNAGQSVTIDFDVQPGVGFEWDLASNEPRGVLVQTDDHEKFAGPPGTVGGPGTRTFTFRADKPGAATLRFHHSYRGKPRGDDTYHVTVSSG